jgi:suppressor of ftsI
VTQAVGCIRRAILAGALLSSAALAQSRCPMDAAPFASPFCSELVAIPGLPNAKGMMELSYRRSPFGISLTAEGRLRYTLTFAIQNLPRPESLGAYSAYVAWGYDLTMGRETRLGVVANGLTRFPDLPFEQFRVLVSAEQSAAATTRRGKLVMRATSPSTLLLAHRDAIMAFASRASASANASRTDSAGDKGRASSAEHAGHEGASAWPMPPVDPRIAPQAMLHDAPTTAPFLPDSTRRDIPEANPRQVLDLRNGDTLTLRAGLVWRRVGNRKFTQYAYNGQSPGPLIRVRQNAEVTIRLRNDLDLPTTIHWHGVRLDNRSDGVPDLTQEPVAPGDSFTYHVRFPDAGIFWYHPHVREDIQQELGLYGNILVASRPGTRAPVNREEILAIDDFLMGGAGPVPFGHDGPVFALMGRFGNQLLINGEPGYTLYVRSNEVVRFYLTNVANARTFNLRIPGARLKVVGSDLGAFEREEWVESVVIAPAERYVVEAHFGGPGKYPILNSVHWLDHMTGIYTPVNDTLGVISADPRRAQPDHSGDFFRLRTSTAAARELGAVRRLAATLPIAHELSLSLSVTAVEPVVTAMLSGMPVPVDFNDAMPMMNWPLTSKEVAWIMKDETGRVNMDIGWRFKVGEKVRIRLRNDPGALHAMAHPIHFHGQRFAVLSRNGVPNDNLVWKDTALLPAGETMDILLELSNPGTWMAHCHVAEHLGTGMMFAFVVEK